MREANTNRFPQSLPNRAWTNVTVPAGVDANGAPRTLTRRVPQIEFVGHEARASAGAIKLSVARNLNTRGAVRMRLPDGQVLTSHVLGLGYYDAASGRSVLLAEITNCTATLEAPDRLVFRNAFDGLLADVRYVYGRASVEQDVLLRETPPSPAEFGLNPDTTRLEVLTEFLSPPAPVKAARPLNLRRLEGDTAAEVSRASAATAPAVVKRTRDERLKFGAAHLIEGKAFESGRSAGLQTGALVSAPVSASGTNRTAQTVACLTVPVAKTWEKMEGRDFLIEAVDYRGVRPTLEKLSRRTAAVNRSADLRSGALMAAGRAGSETGAPGALRGRVTAGRALPAVPPEASAQKRNELAGFSPRSPSDRERNAPMLVLDYVIAAAWQDFVWCDDALPTDSTDDSLPWTWISENPTPYSGSLAHYSELDENGMSHHYFHGAPQTVLIQPGDVLYAWVWLDPESTPGEIMLQWEEGDVWPIGHWDPAEWYEDPPESENWVPGTWVSDGYAWSSSWAHMAYWGADLIGWGSGTNDAHRPMGDLPAAGQWVKLEVPAKLVGLEGKTIHGLAFTAQGGVAVWDRAGKINGDAVWLDDAVPAGGEAGGYSDSNWTNSWRWTNANPAPFHGTQAVQQAPAAFAQNWFQFATNTLLIGAEQTLFAWVYLHPTNPPSELMIQWGITVTNEEELATDWRRSFWGATNVAYGEVDTDYQRWMGPMPASNGWVRLEIPADALGLEGQEIANLSFDVYGGKATWDYVGISSQYDADLDGDGLPDAWERQYFGSHARYGANDDPDGDGLTNLQEFVLGTNPNVADTDGDGVNDGDEVADGTNPLDSNSHRADVTPPVLVITLPADLTNANTMTTSKPWLQLGGYANEPLGSISYDLSNSNGVATNAEVFITRQGIDTNTWTVTTNFFQAFDIPLALGENQLTLRTKDVAGNRTVTNFIVTLSTNADNSPPVVLWQWPTNGALLGGVEFTLRGELDDETAGVCVTTAAGQLVAGVVECNGMFWVEHVPLTNGANALTFTLIDYAGNVSNQAFSVTKSSVELTINAVDPASLWNRTVTVEGTLTNSGYVVWVNGVRATNHGDGTWTAPDVPVLQDGTVTFAATAIPAGANGGNGSAPNTNSASASALKHNPAMLNPSATNAVSKASDPEQSPRTYIYLGFGYAKATTAWSAPLADWFWLGYKMFGGWGFETLTTLGNTGDAEYFEWDDPGPPASPAMTNHLLRMEVNGVWQWVSSNAVSLPEGVSWAHGEMGWLTNIVDGDGNILQRGAIAKTALATGGKGVTGGSRNALFKLTVDADENRSLAFVSQLLPMPEPYASVPGSNIYVLQKQADSQRRVFDVLPDNAILDVTPGFNPKPQHATYSVDAKKYRLTLKSVDFSNSTPIKEDTGDQNDYTTPHWSSNGWSAPVLYGSTESPALIVDTEEANTVDFPIEIEGTASFGPQVGQFHATNSGTTFWASMDTNLPASYVQSANLKIRWNTKTVAGKKLVINLGTSINHLYVSLSNGPPSTYHTVVDLACRKSHGQTDAVTLANSIWSEFGVNGAPVNTSRVDGTKLTYWHTDALPPNGDAAPLVQTSDGRCGNWCSLFQDCLAIQRIYSQIRAIIVKLPENANGWSLDPAPSTPQPTFVNNFFRVQKRAQNEPNSNRKFQDHGVVTIPELFGEMIFDPSYGFRGSTMDFYDAHREWEDNGISQLETDWNSPVSTVTITVPGFRLNHPDRNPVLWKNESSQVIDD